MGASMNKEPAQLTVEEEKAREKAIDFYRYVGKTDAEAMRLAWADLQKAFPRLKVYDRATEVAK
jgi:glutamine synthetase adenylyltransferase